MSFAHVISYLRSRNLKETEEVLLRELEEQNRSNKLQLDEALALSSILNQKNKDREHNDELISQSLDDNIDHMERSTPATPPPDTSVQHELNSVLHEVVDTVEYYMERDAKHSANQATEDDTAETDDNEPQSPAAENDNQSDDVDDDNESDINPTPLENPEDNDQQNTNLDHSIDEEDVTARLKELAEHLSLMEGDDATPLSEHEHFGAEDESIDDWEDDEDLGYTVIPAIPGTDDIYDYVNDEEDYPDQERDNESENDDDDDEVTDDDEEDDDESDEEKDSDIRAKVFELYPNHYSAQKQQVNNLDTTNDDSILDDDDDAPVNDDEDELGAEDEGALEVSVDSSRIKEAWTEEDQNNITEDTAAEDSSSVQINGHTGKKNASTLNNSSLIELDEINAPEDEEDSTSGKILTNNYTADEEEEHEETDERPATPPRSSPSQDDDEHEENASQNDAITNDLEEESSKLQDDEEDLNDDDNYPAEEEHDKSYASSVNQSRRSAEEARMPQFETLYLPVIHERNKTGFEEHKDFPITINSIIAGRYQILEYLGSAAFSRAIQCYDLHTKELVCIKIIKNNKDYFDQSLDEIKLLRYINSRGDPDEHHVVRLYEFFYFKEHLFLVCELLRDNLYEYSKFNRENEEELYFTIPRLQKITRQLLKGLHYIHNLQLIHCDLKPENILIKSYSRCEVKIIDFGSSCFVYDHLCSYVQSRTYRAPEVIFGLPYNEKIDVWSLGCILAELWTGKVLFANTSIQTMIARIIAICGEIPDYMVHEGRFTRKFFSKQYVLYEKEKRTGRINFLLPKKTNLKARLHTDDELFVDFIRQCLIIDPHQRPSIEQCMDHPFLRSNRYRIT